MRADPTQTHIVLAYHRNMRTAVKERGIRMIDARTALRGALSGMGWRPVLVLDNGRAETFWIRNYYSAYLNEYPVDELLDIVRHTL